MPSRWYVEFIGHCLQLTPLSQALRDTQLSVAKLHAETQAICRTSSAPAAPQQSASAPLVETDKEAQTRDELKEPAKKLTVLCSPWPVWRISGQFIVELPDNVALKDSDKARVIMENDPAGDNILSYVPQHLYESFISVTGQKIVSTI